MGFSPRGFVLSLILISSEDSVCACPLGGYRGHVPSAFGVVVCPSWQGEGGQDGTEVRERWMGLHRGVRSTGASIMWASSDELTEEDPTYRTQSAAVGWLNSHHLVSSPSG